MSVAKTKELLQKFGLTPNRALGQNFLADEAAARSIAETACEGMPVLEIGPGLGALTGELLRLAPSVVAVEIDARMAEALSAEFAGEERLEIVRADFLKVDMAALYGRLGEFTVAANLPYYVTTPICMRLMVAEGVRSMTLMMQREAALRLAAAPRDRVYGPLSVLTQYYFEVSEVMALPPAAYYPQPEVESVVLRLASRNAERLEALPMLLEAAFSMRRKTIANNLKRIGISDGRLKELCEKCGFLPQDRAETLTVAQFALIAREISAAGK